MTDQLSLDGLARLIGSPRRGPEEMEVCARVFEALQRRYALPGTRLEIRPNPKSVRGPTRSFQYLCRVYVFPIGRRGYGWHLEGFDEKEAAGCRAEITGDRSGWRQAIPEFDRQFFWGLMVPRGETTARVLADRGITAKVRALGEAGAMFCDEFRDASFGGWYRLGYYVTPETLSGWGTPGALLDRVARDLAVIYRLCDEAFGSEEATEAPRRLPTRDDLERVLAAFAGRKTARVSVEEVLGRLAAEPAGWTQGWEDHVRRNLAAWIREIGRGEETHG